MDILLDISHCKTYIMANIYTYIHTTLLLNFHQNEANPGK